MRYSKQDFPKIVILCLVLIGLLAYIGVSYSKLSARYEAQAAAYAAAHAQEQAGDPASPAQPGTAPPISPTVAALLAPVSPPSRDPFLPVIAPRSYGGVTPATAPAPTPRRRQPALPVLLAPPGESGLGTTPAGTNPNAPSLTGIIVGSPSLAVLRRGADHFIVRPGDELPGSVRVQAIGSNTVTLRDGKRDYVLRLGQ